MRPTSIGKFTLAHLAAKAADASLRGVVSVLTAHEDARQLVRKRIPSLVVGHVACPIELCTERDPEGLSENAQNGEIVTLIGWNAPYQPPPDLEPTLDTQTRTPNELFLEADSFLCSPHE